jgi:hypothetical protein
VSVGIKVYQPRDFIRKTAHGTINLERSLQAVRQLVAAARFQKDHSILLDLHDTEVDGDHADTLQVAAAFGPHFKSFRHKIAVIIPDALERKAKAQFRRTCMHLKGFQWEFFTNFENAFEWLSIPGGFRLRLLSHVTENAHELLSDPI